MKRIDLIGKRFGKLLCTEKIGRKKTKMLWRCVCDCGRISEVTSSNLVTGNTRSCGCGHSHHGLSISDPLYRVWVDMRNRCKNPRHKAYKDYGGRGIAVCNEWEDYSLFHEWAMTHGYQQGLTIEREDNNKGYSPENCRWATMKEQSNNKRTNRMFIHNGITKTLEQWAEVSNLNPITLSDRLSRGWGIGKALATPVKAVFRRKNKEAKNV
jgi:hypothetical protein